jgi:hypothetical protein
MGFIPTTQKPYTATTMKILTEFKEALTSRGFGNSEGGKSSTIEIKEDGTYFLQISSDASNVDEYAFELKCSVSSGAEAN